MGELISVVAEKSVLISLLQRKSVRNATYFPLIFSMLRTVMEVNITDKNSDFFLRYFKIKKWALFSMHENTY
jgi:hypothetical protein